MCVLQTCLFILCFLPPHKQTEGIKLVNGFPFIINVEQDHKLNSIRLSDRYRKDRQIFINRIFEQLQSAVESNKQVPNRIKKWMVGVS